eukprot:503876_1
MSAPDASNNSHQQIISVGIIGNSNNSHSKHWICKQLISNHITNSITDDDESLYDPFEWIRTFQSATQNDKCAEKSMLSIYDDTESGIIYFNLKSHDNLTQLNKLLSQLCLQKSQYEFHRILQSNERCYIKSLIFLFLTCHHILLFCDAPRFNPQWLSIFHFLQEIKLKLMCPIISIMNPIINHIINTNETNKILSFLDNNNLSPFIIPVLTFLYPSPDINIDIIDDNPDIVKKAIVRKFKQRLQQQIVVLLRRCHSIFPYFQTVLSGNIKYGSLSHKELFSCIDSLKTLGFDTISYLDSEIYSTHSRWIETDDMMHSNPLSLFSLLPNKFIQIYTEIDNKIELNSSLRNKIKSINYEIKSYLRGDNKNLINSQKKTKPFSDRINDEKKENKNNNKNKNNNNKMPSRILFYVTSKI